MKPAVSLIKELQLSCKSSLSVVVTTVADMLPRLVEIAINLTLEGDESDRETVSKFFAALYKEKVLSDSNFVKGYVLT